MSQTIAPPAIAQCDPTAGDQLYSWVRDRVPTLSRQLAKADYDARNFNYFLVGFDDIHSRLDKIDLQLDSIATQIRAVEQVGTIAAAGPAVVDQAIQRERDSQDELDNLFAVQRDLQETRRRLQLLTKRFSTEEFRADGLQNVGRETLVASLQDLSNAAGNSLNDKYSVFISVTVDESGNFQQASAESQAGMWDTIALAGASYFGPPGYAAFALVEFNRFSIEDSICQERIREQREKVRAALQLLPNQLVTPDEQFHMYTDSFAATYPMFADQADKIDALLNSIESRWSDLMAYDAARNAAAHSVLTAAKVDALEKAYGHDDHVTSIFDNAMLTDVAEEISDLNSYIATNEGTMLVSCGDVVGYETAENQEDALRYSEESYKALLRLPHFAPLNNALNISMSEADQTLVEVERLRKGLSTRACNGHGITSSFAMKKSILAINKARSTITSTIRSTAVRQSALSQSIVSLPIVSRPEERSAVTTPPSSNGMEFCELSTDDGQKYLCGANGTPYDNQFNSGGGDPRGDVLEGGNDGGYGSDNRRVSDDIASVDDNVEVRITGLLSRVKEANSGLPSWIEKNSAAVDDLHRVTLQKQTLEKSDRDHFDVSAGPSIAFARSAIATFVESPFDPSRVAALVSSIGGADLSLPQLPTDSLVPGAPRVSGFTAYERVYGSHSDHMDQTIIRERLKAARDLANSPNQLAIANNALDLAHAFSSSGTQLGGRFATELVRDSEAIRYVALKERPAADLSYVSADGDPGRSVWPNGTELSSQTVIARGESFQNSYDAFSMEYSTLKSGLPADAPDSPRRQAVAEAALGIATIARVTFYSGALGDGERLLRMAHSALDIATRFIPGINLGRDVYEAVSGVDMFTGDKLDALARSAAVLGVLTLGFEDEIEGAVKAIRLLGVSAEREEEIIQASRTIKADSVEMTDHAIKRMNEPGRLIDQSEINDAIDHGTRFWDNEEGTMVAFEVDVAPGVDRAAAAIDIDSKEITTVFREPMDDEALSKYIEKGRQKYTRLSPKIHELR
jgi:hypothetical protein